MFNFLSQLFELNSYKQVRLKAAIDTYCESGKDRQVAQELLTELTDYDKDTAAAFEFYLS